MLERRLWTEGLLDRQNACFPEPPWLSAQQHPPHNLYFGGCYVYETWIQYDSASFERTTNTFQAGVHVDSNRQLSSYIPKSVSWLAQNLSL